MTQLLKRTLLQAACFGIGLVGIGLGIGLAIATAPAGTPPGGRPHIEFIQSQALPWQPNLWRNAFPGADVKILSINNETGEASTLVRYPAGWSRSGSAYLTADEELFVLGGSLDINGVTYGEKAYAHLPAGFLRTSSSSSEGAVVLTFVAGKPGLVNAAQAPPSYDATRLVEHIDTLSSIMSANFGALGVASDDPIAAGISAARFLMFRDDPYTHDQTWLLSSGALSTTGVEEIHPVVEELYLVEGEAVTDVGLMLPGAYVWRPPDLRHGPVGTRTGTVKFFRTKGGPLVTEFPDTGRKFSWVPVHRPILPPHLVQYGQEPGQAALPY